MNKKFFISWIVIFIAWMAGSFVVHGLLLGDMYAAQGAMYRPEADQQNYFHFMLLGHVFLAGGFVWIYQQGKSSADWLGQGVRYGIAIAFLASIPTYLIYYAVQPTPGGLVVRQIAFDSALVIILGMLIAFLNKSND